MGDQPHAIALAFGAQPIAVIPYLVKPTQDRWPPKCDSIALSNMVRRSLARSRVERSCERRHRDRQEGADARTKARATAGGSSMGLGMGRSTAGRSGKYESGRDYTRTGSFKVGGLSPINPLCRRSRHTPHCQRPRHAPLRAEAVRFSGRKEAALAGGRPTPAG
jgi:hypothetical protein